MFNGFNSPAAVVMRLCHVPSVHDSILTLARLAPSLAIIVAFPTEPGVYRTSNRSLGALTVSTTAPQCADQVCCERLLRLE
jgi:hypothetical protein